MSVEHIYTGHEKDLGGGFIVRRLLPGHPRRGVGPFVFFDHFGPTEVDPVRGFEVRPHPHIGLATVTYLFEGAIMHRDSLGSEQKIEPGAINWMIAGRGIVHSERTPEENRGRSWRCHGLQLWIALPASAEEMAPAFRHHGADTIPEWTDEAVSLRLMAGTYSGRVSPVETLSPMAYVDAAWRKDGAWTVHDAFHERAIYPVEGAIDIDGKRIESGRMALLAPGTTVTLRARAGTRAVLIAGEPLDGPRHIWWNFVSSRRDRIERARSDWAADRFPPVPGDDERIPLPDGKPA